MGQLENSERGELKRTNVAVKPTFLHIATSHIVNRRRVSIQIVLHILESFNDQRCCCVTCTINVIAALHGPHVLTFVIPERILSIRLVW